METGAFRAQFGEDRILAQELRVATGYCVEVGANDGVTGSNTFYFESVGWHCLLVEADPELAARCRDARPRSQVVECAAVAPGGPDTVTFSVITTARGVSSLSVDSRNLSRLGIEIPAGAIVEITVAARTLDSVLEDAHYPRIDFMTIDVEGHEWEVLLGLDLDRWKPAILILERNRHYPDQRIMRRLRDHGYAWRRTTGVNDWFYVEGTGRTLAPAYQRWLFQHYYLPKYAQPWRALAPEFRAMERGARDAIRGMLDATGLLEAARRLRDRYRA